MIDKLIAWVETRAILLLGIALIVAIGGLAVQRVEIARLQTKVAQAETKLETQRADAATAFAAAIDKAAKDSHAMQEAKDAAIAKALQVAQANARALAAATAVSDGLRRDLASVPERIRNASDAAVREYATTASAVLDDCQRKYVEMAGFAQGHATDVQLLLDAWPVQPSQRASEVAQSK